MLRKYQKQHQRLSVLSYQYLFRFFVCLRSRLSKSQKFCQKQPIFWLSYFFRSVSIWRRSYASESSTYLFHRVDLYFSCIFVNSLWISLLLLLLPLRSGAHTRTCTRCLAHCFYLFIFIAGLLRLLLYKVQQSAWTMLSACVSVCVRQSGERQRGQTPPHALKSTFFILR